MGRKVCVKFGSNPERKKVFNLADGGATAYSDLSVLRNGLFSFLKLDAKSLSNIGGNQYTTAQDLILYRCDDPDFGEIEVEDDCILNDKELVTMKLQVENQPCRMFLFNDIIMI